MILVLLSFSRLAKIGQLTDTDVDEGSTVTDFLRTERARGVTIQSAAISFHWPPLPNDSAPFSPPTANLVPHNINLIDTPGHADFTFEVLRSLRILDGAVCILDGVAGVEAQTEKVWYQAAKYRIPKIIYVNKLDRDGAAFGETVRQIASRLHTYPAVCHIPWWEGGKGQFCGLGDAIGLRAIRWTGSGDGTNFEIVPFAQLKELNDGLHAEISKARKALVEILAENDDQMVEKYLDAEEDSLAISSADVVASLRRCVLSQANIVPVFAGASFRNMGVQLLLDAIVEILPSPVEALDPEVKFATIEGKLSEVLSGKLLTSSTALTAKDSMAKFKKPNLALIETLESCALAFKVVHDPRRGVLVYVRTYSGSLQRQAVLFNTNLQVSERAPQLLKMYASESVQVDSIPAGQIGVIPGLKYARTGDTLISYKGATPKSSPPAPLNSIQLRPIEVPPAVFFSSVEPHSLSEEKATKAALEILVREDPSLQVTEDEETGQTLLSGMGEFHLEIAQDRLVNDLKAKASMGDIEIAYREAILGPSLPQRYEATREQSGKQGRAACTASVSPLMDDLDIALNLETDFSTLEESIRITFTIAHPEPAMDDPEETSVSKTSLSPHPSLPTIHHSIKNGVLAALGRGILHPFRLHNTHVHLTLSPSTDIFGSETTPSALSSAARSATKLALKASVDEHSAALLELVMNVVVSVNEENLGGVVNDLSSNRGGNIISLDDGEAGDAAFGSSGTEREAKIFTPIPAHKVYTPPDPFALSPNIASNGNNQSSAISDGATSRSQNRTITARVPLKEMVGYLKHLRSLTGGRGTFVMSPHRFERVTGVREKALLRELRGVA